MDEFIHIRSDKFPVLDGEDQELVNEGMYGKAFGNYLCLQLKGLGYECSDPFCEDWGWAMFASSNDVSAMLCIYSDPNQRDPKDFAITAGGSKRKWSWRSFRYVNTAPDKEWYAQFQEALVSVLQEDPEIEVIGLTKEFPLG
jgi:hypothetical protein